MLKRLTNPRHAEARTTLAILALLLAVGSVSPSAFRYRPHEDTVVKKVFRTLKKRGLNRQAAASQTAGYYEGLLDQAAQVTRVGGRGWLDWRFWLIDRPRRVATAPQRRRDRGDFLRYDLPPNVDIPDRDERRRLVTNSIGLADREYSQKPAAGTWRIALVGDSVSRGMGAEFGTSYEARLEEFLNQRFAGRGHDRYEILNFAVEGYQLTQLVDVTVDRVPPFSPNVYAVALTERSVFNRWADHLAGVVRNGVDLKYPFLKEIVSAANVTPNLSDPLVNARLARYRVPVLRWALQEMQAQARRDRASLVVLLVPTADDPELQIEQFQGVRDLLGEMAIPTVDLLETFAYVDDIAPFRVGSADRHPNEEGHRILFEALVTKIEREDGLRGIFTGPRSPSR